MIGDGGGQVRRRRQTELPLQRGELLDRHGARFIEPPQIDRQIRERGLQEHPGGRLVHMAQPLEHIGIRVGRWRGQQIPKVRIGHHAVSARERGSSGEQRAFRGIAANGGEQRELLQRFGKGSRG